MSKKKCTDGRRNNRPPQHTRFGQPGGNPINDQGRPAGRTVIEFGRLSEEALWECVLQSALKPVDITEEGRDYQIPLIMVITKQMAREAASGDRRCRNDMIKLLERATQYKDERFHNMHLLLANQRERMMNARHRKGTLEHYDGMYKWFMTLKHLRAIDGDQSLPYEDGEPVTNEQWDVFLKNYDHLKTNPTDILQWPPAYWDDDAPEPEQE